MKFRSGDKVRFLNEKGEGVITRITSNGVAYVDVQGFEIPFALSELVPAFSPDKAGTKSAGKTAKNEPEEEYESEAAVGYERLSEPIIQPYKGVAEGVFLAVVPADERRLLDCPLSIYLVNATVYNIMFTCSIRQPAGYLVISSGKLEAGREVLLKKIQRNELEKYSQLKVDALFYSDNPYDHQPPVSELVKLRVVKFYKETTYVPNPFFDSRAFITPVSGYEALMQQEDYHDSIKQQDIARLILEKERPHRKGSVSRKHITNTGELEQEVDLHIEELVDDFRGMNNTEIITIQLNYFRQRLEEAIAGQVRKITFIHGIGNGRLKHEVRRLLSTYEGVRFHDAPYSRYGFGATEVIIR
jgi:hypothetical protein